MKYILITGVSRGLGAITAKKLAEKGYGVIGLSRSSSEELINLKEKFSESFIYHKYDLSNCENIKSSIFSPILKNNQKIVGFVNNAAIAYDDIISNVNYSKLMKMYKVNVLSPIILTKYVIRNMLLHKNAGSIVHISSISVHTGYKGLAMYASSKGALEAFSKNTAREWGVRNIRSNCVVAGFMETDMSASLTTEQKHKIYRRTSLKKATSVSSVAKTVKFLLSNSAESITGQNIHVDSGTI